MYQQEILKLIGKARDAQANGFSRDAIVVDLLPAMIPPLLESAGDFLRWVKEDKQYSFFYFEAQESGVCAKPAEAAALILEAIVVDALEENRNENGAILPS